MATLKKMQAEKDSGEWENLSEQAQQQVGMTFLIIILFTVFQAHRLFRKKRYLYKFNNNFTTAGQDLCFAIFYFPTITNSFIWCRIFTFL